MIFFLFHCITLLVNTYLKCLKLSRCTKSCVWILNEIPYLLHTFFWCPYQNVCFLLCEDKDFLIWLVFFTAWSTRRSPTGVRKWRTWYQEPSGKPWWNRNEAWNPHWRYKNKSASNNSWRRKLPLLLSDMQ